MRLPYLLTIILTSTFLLFLVSNVQAESSAAQPANVQVGVWLVNIEKVDLAASSYKLDFYLWFRFDPSVIDLDKIKEFEFVNGFPTKYEIYADEERGYLEYRVRGDFIKTFDFSRYPYETHELSIELEHKNLNAS
ncbi:MAG: hypothetical protein QW840_04790, partial [Candidatus Bathyarchaeia archaeon]